MNERVKFIAAMLEANESFTELCERFGISRKQGYKWKERYESGGVDALRDRSRAPKTHPHVVTEPLVELIVQARRKHPRWGPRKLLVILARQYPTMEFPVASTVGEILKKQGLIGPKRRRLRSSLYSQALGGYAHPNAIWCADFKGHFPVGGERCNPLTISDGFSRYLLCCRSLKSTTFEPVRHAFESVFREYGLPDAIRTDNGPPFSSLAPGGLSRLAVWWIRLGIRHERIMPGRPDQNGRHERMHSTLKAETARPPRSSFKAQQRAFDSFRDEYNQVRPHEALGYDTPASRYRPSPKPFPNKPPELEYPSHFRVQRAQRNGVISVDGVQFYVSNCVDEEYIGLEPVDDGCWKVYFGTVALGMLDARRAKQLSNGRLFSVLVRTDGTRRRFYGRVVGKT
ncbi:MAG TPA: IS481 family transposase [Polyangiaceae bacterium]